MGLKSKESFKKLEILLLVALVLYIGWEVSESPFIQHGIFFPKARRCLFVLITDSSRTQRSSSTNQT